MRPLAAPGSAPGFGFYALGWPMRTPSAQRALSALAYRDLLQALGNARGGLLAPPEAAAWIEQYALRHRGTPIVLVPEASVPGFAVFRAARRAPGEAADRVLRSDPAGPE